MPLSTTIFRVDVSETDGDRNYWASQAGLSSDAVTAIRSADIVLVPWESRGAERSTFPVGTTDFFRSLSRLLGEGTVAIAADPAEYVELALHSNETRWPSILVNTVFLSALATVLGDEVEKLISRSGPQASIELTVTVENERGKCVSVSYKGPPNRLVDTLVQETARCFPQGPDAKPSGHSTALNSKRAERAVHK
jgi:hypothetical protein